MTVAEVTSALTITNINDVRHDFLITMEVNGEVMESTINDDSSAISLLAIAQLLLGSDSDINREVRRRIASHPNAAGSTLELLSSDRQAWVRRAVATHPNTPVGVLHALAADKSSDVRIAVAKNRNTHVLTLEILVKDESSMVRLQAIEHPEMSTESLLRSLHEQSPVVYQKVLENLVRRAYPEAKVRA